MDKVLEIKNRCISCDLCAILCPEDAIIKLNTNYIIDSWTCTQCEICIHACPTNCIKYKEVEDLD